MRTDTQEQIIINTGQLKVSRFNTGNIRVVLNAIRETFVGETLSAAFPINELHHLEVTWDGSLANNNLIVSRDGILVQVFTVPGHCDFDDRPVTGVIGQNFSGMLDEMRISDSVRTIFNLVNKQEGVQFNSLQTGTSTNSKNPALNVVFNTQNLVDPTKVKVLLNGVQQPTGGSLVVTGSGISGSLPGDLIEGLNTVTVDFIDSNGNEVLKTANFYYINTLPLAPNAVDSNTLALWHFEDPQASAMIDSSGNGHDINTYPNDPNVQTVQGVFGLGRQFSATYSTANNLALGSRSFTIDGWMKILPSPSPSAYYSGPVLTYRSDAENLYITMPINAVTGDVELTFSSRDGSFDRTFQSLFPTDQQFHHLALIFDSSRSFSQILIAVDGVVKQTVDFTASCDFTQPGLLQISASTYAPTVFDEFRVSNTARYRYNISALPLPVIDSVSPLAETTVHNSSVSVSYVVHGTQGISTNDTYLSVNGVRQTGLTLSPSGVSATLSGVVSGLVSGANQFELHVADASGTATSQTMMVYLINQGPASAYTADVNTIALYHMDEMSGNVLADSSGNSYDLTLNGAWPLGAAGVFGTCAQMPSSYIYGQNSNFANVTGLGQSTVEGWFRLSNIDDSRPTILNLGNGNVLNLYVASGGIGAFWNSSLGQQDLRVTGVLPVDGKFHHAAVILDSAGAYRNMYLVLDGSVVLSRKVAPGGTTLVSGSGSVQIGGGSVTAFDEIRFSNVARYTLNYSKTKGIFQPISVGDRLGRVWIRLKAKVTKTVAEVLK